MSTRPRTRSSGQQLGFQQRKKNLDEQRLKDKQEKAISKTMGLQRSSKTAKGNAAKAAAQKRLEKVAFEEHKKDVAASKADRAEAAELKARSFDLDVTFGPCKGLSRRERFARAVALNLNPPQQIRDLLDSAIVTDQSIFDQHSKTSETA